MLDQHTGPPDNVLPESDSAQFFLGVSVGGGMPGIGWPQSSCLSASRRFSHGLHCVGRIIRLFMSCPWMVSLNANMVHLFVSQDSIKITSREHRTSNPHIHEWIGNALKSWTFQGKKFPDSCSCFPGDIANIHSFISSSHFYLRSLSPTIFLIYLLPCLLHPQGHFCKRGGVRGVLRTYDLRSEGRGYYWARNYYLLWVAWNWVKKIAFSCLLWVNKMQINYPISLNP